MFGWTEAQGNKYPSITDSANYHTIEALPPGEDEGVEGLRCPWYFMGASKAVCRARPGHVGCARGVQLVGDLCYYYTMNPNDANVGQAGEDMWVYE